MRLNTNVIMLPEPVVVYDRDSEEFFLKIGSFVSTNAEIPDGQLREAEGSMNRAVNRNVRFAEYPINASGEILQDIEPYSRFLVVGPKGSKINATHIAMKEACYAGFRNNNYFKKRFRWVLNELSQKYGITVNLLDGGSNVDFVVELISDEDDGGMFKLTTPFHSDIFGGVLYEKEVPSVDDVVDDIVNHLNNVAPSICTGKLFVNLDFRNLTKIENFSKVRDAVASYSKEYSDKIANWELI